MSSSPQTIRALEFYSGIGGLHYALLKSRPDADILKAFDWDPTSCQVYQANHGPIIDRVRCGQSLSLCVSNGPLERHFNAQGS